MRIKLVLFIIVGILLIISIISTSQEPTEYNIKCTLIILICFVVQAIFIICDCLRNSK